MATREYIDPEGYWRCPEGGIRRMGDEDGEQAKIVQTTKACSVAERKAICDAADFTRSARIVPKSDLEANQQTIQRMRNGTEPEVIANRLDLCSEAEWEMILEKVSLVPHG